MLVIQTKVVCHHITIKSSMKHVAHRNCKVCDKKQASIDKEVKKWKYDNFIIEIKYPTLLANDMLVQKAYGKWEICVDFTNLNFTCSKDPQLLLNIDRLIDILLGYTNLSFMDDYSGYNQIKTNLLESPKTIFISNKWNYYYEVMSFELKNKCVTYQRIMDIIFSNQIKHNLKVYIDGWSWKPRRN